MKERFYEHLKQFQIEDIAYDLIPIKNSHINDTYRVQDKKGVNRYIIQRINSYVFPEPEKVMENIVLVTKHIFEKVNEPHATLTLVFAKDGNSFIRDGKDYIRMFKFIESGYSCDEVTSLDEFRQVAVTIARFHKLLADIDISRLHITIPDFHNTPKRLEGFKKVVAEDPMQRADKVRDEIDFILEREPLARAFEGKIVQDGLRIRATHNDTKPANIMLCKDTKEALCMIDLDTVMPGLICDDFGDAIRSGTCMVKEEIAGQGEQVECKEDKYFDEQLYKAFYDAFVKECGDMLTPTEKEMLPVGAMKLTYEQALRFLEDYLKGDVYFKVSDEEQNLRRARVQMKLLEEMEEVLQ